ncbi:hypothetical protein ACTFIY_001736 [Dictyostelium cf. discoideum]
MKNGFLLSMIILLLSIFISFSNSQNLLNLEQNCLTNLGNKISKYKDPNAWCSSFSCALSADSSYLYIETLKIENTNGVTAPLNYTDFSCFSNLTKLDITHYTLNYSSFFGDISEKGLAISIVLNQTFNLDFPKLVNFPTTSLEFVLAYTPGTIGQFSASSFGNLKSLIFTTNPLLQPIPAAMTLPTLHNDLNSYQKIQLDKFQFVTREVPNLNYFNITELYLVLQPTIAATGDFNSFSDVQIFTLIVDTDTQVIDFPSIFTLSNNIIQAELKAKFSPPVSNIDITLSSKLRSLRFTQINTGISSSFAYPPPNGFPLILPTSIELIFFPNTGIILPQLNTLPNLGYLDFHANSITSLPSEISPSLKYLELSENSISGTIPPLLFCNTLLNVNNNNFNGYLPECFQCYYNIQPILNIFFSGNPNLNISGPCTLKPVPNFSLDPVLKIFRLWGSNLGYAYPTTSSNVSFTLISIPNSEFFGTYNDLMTALVIEFSFMGSIFTLPLTPNPPNIVNVHSNGISTFSFNGQYFTYNTSDVTITLGGYPCQVTFASFQTITCMGSSFQNGSELVVNFKIGIYSTQISLIQGAESNNVTMCTQSCNHGYCSTVGTVGKCICNPGYAGNDCSVSNPCPSTCLNGGNCNYFNGLCNCTSTWTGTDCGTPYIECANECLNGQCNYQTGMCLCNIGWGGTFCNEYSLDCPKNCSFSNGGGVCNRTVGECKCNSNYQSNDCSIPYVECNSNCNSNSNVGNKCNNQTGICICSTYWQGLSCESPSHYISSIQPTTTDGGFVLIYGWFGGSGYHNNPMVTIGTLECKINSINESLINCTIGSGSGTKSVSVQQNGYTYVGKDIFHYTDITYKCPNNCSGHGTCNKLVGQCKCFSGWGGFDCNGKIIVQSSSTTTTTSASTTATTTSGNTTPEPTQEPIVIPETVTTINTTIGSALINNEKTLYEIKISKIVELDFNGVSVKTINLQEKWNVEIIAENNTYIFKQTLNGTNCTVTYSIEEVKTTRDYNFAGLDLTLDAGGIKITVKIENYQYLNSLNTLQLQIESLIGSTTKNDDDEDNECNKENLSVDTNEMDKDQLLNYITISKDQKILYGRFINRVVSDTRPTFITTSVVSNNGNSVILGLNLPHCINSCLIDPDFSVLVSSSFKTCDNSKDSGRPAWLLPVVIVVPCVVVASIIIIGAVIYRKNRMAILVAKNKYSFSLRKMYKKN